MQKYGVIVWDLVNKGESFLLNLVILSHLELIHEHPVIKQHSILYIVDLDSREAIVDNRRAVATFMADYSKRRKEEKNQNGGN